MIAILAALSAYQASADDALVKVAGGCASLISDESVPIRMSKAEIHIRFLKKEYVVDAEFTFDNPGDSRRCLVGFPFYGYGYSGDFVGVEMNGSFKTWVDGEEVPFKDVPGTLKARYEGSAGERTVVASDAGSIDALRFEFLDKKNAPTALLEETRWLVKDVAFEKGKATRTKVHYAAKYRVADGGWYLGAEYLYGTGRSWDGTIGELTVELTTSPTVWLTEWPKAGSPYERVRLEDHKYQLMLKNVEPEEREKMEMSLSTKAPAFCFFDVFEYVDGTKMVPDEILDLLSSAHLTLLAEYIQASRGKPTRKLAGCPWYSPRNDFSPEDLTPIDRQNLERIERYKALLQPSPSK